MSSLSSDFFGQVKEKLQKWKERFLLYFVTLKSVRKYLDILEYFVRKNALMASISSYLMTVQLDENSSYPPSSILVLVHDL